jgi:hypothetical protein
VCISLTVHRTGIELNYILHSWPSKHLTIIRRRREVIIGEYSRNIISFYFLTIKFLFPYWIIIHYNHSHIKLVKFSWWWWWWWWVGGGGSYPCCPPRCVQHCCMDVYYVWLKILFAIIFIIISDEIFIPCHLHYSSRFFADTCTRRVPIFYYR